MEGTPEPADEREFRRKATNSQRELLMTAFRAKHHNPYDDYVKMAKIGHGTFGEVWQALHIYTNKFYALKKVPSQRGEGFPTSSLMEIRILKTLLHKNIVNMIEVISAPDVSEDGDYTFKHYLVFEYCEHDLAGILWNRNLVFTLADIKALAEQLLMGVLYIHANDLIHRDLKTSNVLVTKRGIVKICDFGTSRWHDMQKREKMTNPVVTLWYRPPELLLGSEDYDTRIDIWSTACILAEMWTRWPIIQGSSEQSQLELINKLCGSINPEVWPDVAQLKLFCAVSLDQNEERKVLHSLQSRGVDALGCDLIDKMLILDPAKRLNAAQALNHDFFFEPPMPASSEELKKTFSKIPPGMYSYFGQIIAPGPEPKPLVEF